MQPNIRVKRYATRSKHARRKPRRRGSIATAILVILILIVAGLAVGIALSPQKKETTASKSSDTAPAQESQPGALEETAAAEATGAAGEALLPIGGTSRKPVSVSSISADPQLITPSALPNCTGDDGLYPSTTVTIEMSRPATVSVRVLDPHEATVGRLFSGRLSEGSQSWEWDGKYANGDPVASGKYVVRAQVLSSDEASEQGAFLESKLEAVQFIMRGNKSRRAVALTIDDGWNADMRIVSYLKKNKVPATAFLIGGRGIVDAQPNFVRSLMGAGMEIANHTYDHEWLTKLSPPQIRRDISRAQRLITKITGYDHHWVRASGGAISAEVLRTARGDGYHLAQWTIDSGDAMGGADAQGTLDSAANGSIILTHFGGKGTYDYITQIVPALRKRGFTFVTLSSLMAGMRVDQRLDIPPTRPLVRTLRPAPSSPLAPLR